LGYSNCASFKIIASTDNRIFKSEAQIENFHGDSESRILVNKFFSRNKLTYERRNFHILSSQHRTNVGNILVGNEESMLGSAEVKIFSVQEMHKNRFWLINVEEVIKPYIINIQNSRNSCLSVIRV
jgi:hypothetical protein